MSGAARELDAAGILDPVLRTDYARCRDLAAAHGRTYFLATRLLPAADRPAVHALYGFARAADEVVDDLEGRGSVVQQAAGLDALTAQLRAGVEATEPVCRAVTHTASRYGINPTLFEDFLASMRMDLSVTEYPTFAALEQYMHGSAEVIGLQLLPVFGTVGPAAQAAPYAARLGVAFQLTNFIRDVGEDLRRGRIYLPGDAREKFGVDHDRLARGVVDQPIRDWLGFEIARTREIYQQAEPGIALLDPRARPCVETAFNLYREILAEVERADYQVLGRRVSVGNWPRLRVAGSGLIRAVIARRRAPTPVGPRPTGSA